MIWSEEGLYDLTPNTCTQKRSSCKKNELVMEIVNNISAKSLNGNVFQIRKKKKQLWNFERIQHKISRENKAV